MKLRNLSPEVIKNKVVVIRVDFNVPLKNGIVQETTRIEETIPTLKLLLKNGAKKIHILTHVGRPKDGPDPSLSTKNLLPVLEKFLGEKVEHRADLTDGTGKIQLHENTRFWPGDQKSDPTFTDKLLKNLKPDIFVNDGFGVSHRGDASVVGLAKFVPAYPGLLVEKEVEALSPFLTDKKVKGLTVLIGGVKMETKIPVLKHFAKIAENILVGGALANTFEVAQGFDVGASLYEKDFVETAREVMEEAEKYKTGVHLPVDFVCADDMESEKTVDAPIEDVGGDMKIFDIGPHTVASFTEILRYSHTIIWNGPLGVMEKKPFSHGTHGILEAMRKLKAMGITTILGGGDTLEALKQWQVPSSEFSHVSTGGGAMLEFLAGEKLPGIEILKNVKG